MIHPHTELRYINDVMGHGVFATRLIPKGTLTWVRDELDQTFTAEQVARMTPAYRRILDKYSFVDSRGRVVLCWDHSRFFNHSCAANCLSAGNDCEFAIRDILPGEELTDDYGTLNLREPFACACGVSNCRRLIMPDDLARLDTEWDDIIRRVFPLITTVEQPLWEFLQEKAEVEAALRRPEQLRSIRHHYAPAPQVFEG